MGAKTDPVGLYIFLGVMAFVGFAWAVFRAGLWRRGWGYVFITWAIWLGIEVVLVLVGDAAFTYFIVVPATILAIGAIVVSSRWRAG